MSDTLFRKPAEARHSRPVMTSSHSDAVVSAEPKNNNYYYVVTLRHMKTPAPEQLEVMGNYYYFFSYFNSKGIPINSTRPLQYNFSLTVS